MTDYVLAQPVTALQYSLRENEQALMELARSTGTDGISMDNARGYFRLYNGGVNVEVHDGEWLVAIGGELIAMSAERFAAAFKPV